MISLYDVLESADGQLFGEPTLQLFTGFAIEPDQVVPGCLYVATQTARGDGHRWIQTAIERGALGVMCVEPPEYNTDGITVIVVRDAEKALLTWARMVLERFGTTVIAVSGAVGKATAAAAIAAVLSTRYSVYHAPFVAAGRLTLPLALGGLTAQHQMAVIVLPPDLAGNMRDLVSLARPMVGVVTCGGDDGAGQGDPPEQEGLALRALMEALPDGGLAVLNFDDALARGLGAQTPATVFSVGIDSFDADLLAYNIVLGRYRTGFDLRYGVERAVGRWTPLLGRHHLYSALAGLAVGLSYEVPLQDGLRALTEVPWLPGRFHPHKGLNDSLVIDDTCSPGIQSVTTALDWLGAMRASEAGRAVVVLGDLDLPADYTQPLYRQIGERIAAVADLLVAQGNLAATVARAAMDYGLERYRVRITHGPADTLAAARDGLGPHDFVLVKGGRTTGLGEVVRGLLQDQADGCRLAPAPVVVDAWLGGIVQPSWVEVDLSAIGQNVRRLRALVGPGVALMAMVPADAYGHGAIGVASTALLNGAGYLGVGTLDEGVALREAGLEAPILVMGFLSPAALRDALRYDLTIGLSSLAAARQANAVGGEMGRRLRAHIHLDCGAPGLGFPADESVEFFRAIKKMPHLDVEGLYTILASGAEDLGVQRARLSSFQQQVKPLLAIGLPLPYVHAADGAALLALPEARFTLVRADLPMYGLPPLAGVPLPEGLKPALAWKTVIAQAKMVAGTGSRSRRADSPAERIAVIPVGYADGFRSEPQRWQRVLVRGRRVPVLGSAGPHETILDVSAVPDVRAGDEVVLIGTQEGEAISIEEVAGWLRCGAAEVLSGLAARLCRGL